jgi:ABC-type phosphate/phosphonate transport system substrate-binding protein
MLSEGLHPLDDLDPSFLGSHDQVFDAVVAGECAGGAVYAGALREGRSRNPDAGRLRIIAKTERIPYDAFVARAGFPAAVSSAVAEVLIGISTRDAEGRRLLSNSLQVNGYMRVDDDHYDVVREVGQAVAKAFSDN